MSKIKAGSVVRLKSGGPKMTVVRLWDGYSTDGEKAFCQWFSRGRLDSQSFQIDILEVVSE